MPDTRAAPKPEVVERAPALDDVDREIIKKLSIDPQVAAKRIAAEIGISESTVATRIDSLISKGLMRVTARRDLRTLGYTMLAVVEIHAEGDRVASICAALKLVPQVLTISLSASHPQITTLVSIRRPSDLPLLVARDISSIDGVRIVEMDICLDVLNFRPDAGLS